jgi:hypothetical protein
MPQLGRLARVRNLALHSLLPLSLVAAAGCGQSSPPPPQSAAGPAGAGKTAPKAAVAQAAPVIGPPLQMAPAADARAWLLASITIPSIDKTLASGTALVARAVPLPLDAASVKEMLLNQAGLPAPVGENLDTASPSGVAVVALSSASQPAKVGLVMAVPAKGVEQAERVITALGSVVAKRSGAVEIDNGTGGRGWVWQAGRVLVISDSVEGLSRGAMLALEARQSASTEDLTAVLHPEAIARANGTDLKTGLALFVAAARAAQASQSGAADEAGDHSLDVLQDLAGYLVDTDTVEIGLSMNTAQGLLASLRLRPRAGSGLEKLAREAHPFAIDPVLLGGTDEISLAAASSLGPFSRAQLAKQRARLQAGHDKGAAAALQVFDASLEAMAGSWAGVGRLKPNLSLQAVYPLKDAAAGAKLGAALARFDTAAMTALWKTQVPPAQQKMLAWRLKKEPVGRLKALHCVLSVSTKTLAPSARDAAKNLLGGESLDVFTAVAGNRLVVAVGKDAKAQLAAVAGGKKSEAKGASNGESRSELLSALAAAKGKDSFGYFDLAPALGLVSALSDDPRAAALAAAAPAPIPVYGTFSSEGEGKVMTFALTLPSAAFSGVGAVLQGVGASGAGAGPGAVNQGR